MLSRKEINNKTICVNCKYCKQETIEHSAWTEYRFLCTNCVSYIDNVTGDEIYMPCHTVNLNGECSKYEKPQRSKIERFFNALMGKKDK